jgi:hypothetical protein
MGIVRKIHIMTIRRLRLTIVLLEPLKERSMPMRSSTAGSTNLLKPQH